MISSGLEREIDVHRSLVGSELNCLFDRHRRLNVIRCHERDIKEKEEDRVKVEGEGKEKKKKGKKEKKERDKRLAGELECTMFGRNVRTRDSKNSSAASRSLTGRGVRLGLL